jgi:hypothetical protein
VSLDRETVVEALPAYEVGEEIGRGAWGVVIAGRHRELGREVAIKQLPRAFGNEPSVKKRFRAEAKLLASLDHPHIVPVYDFVEHEGVCLLVMARLTGGTVWSRFTSEGLSQADACAAVLATCAGLHHAHRTGVLHRDVKPENLMFSGEGVLKVTDFGIAKVVGGAATMATRTGHVLGTPAYIAPEQAEGAELSPATDVYAAGTVLYELLCGSLPFPMTGDPLSALYQRVHTDPRPLLDSAPATPPPLAEVVQRAIERDPSNRFASAEQFGSALARSVTTTWGTDWRSQTTIVLRGVDSMLPTGDVEVNGADGGRAPATLISAGASGPRRRGTRPEQAGRQVVTAAELSPAELVPADRVAIEPRRPPGRARAQRWWPLPLVLAALAAAAIAILVTGGGGDNASTTGARLGLTADRLAGAWSGEAIQTGGRPFHVSLSIKHSCSVNERCGSISVSSVPCTGRFFFVGRKGPRYEFSVAHFSADSGKACTPGAGEYLTPQDDGTLLYTTSYDPGIRGTLRRAGAGSSG